MRYAPSPHPVRLLRQCHDVHHSSQPILTLKYHTVLLFYDYILTFDKEVGLFWKKRISGASLLFFCNRYLTLLTQMFDMVQFTTDMSDEVRVRRGLSATLPLPRGCCHPSDCHRPTNRLTSPCQRFGHYVEVVAIVETHSVNLFPSLSAAASSAK